MKAFTTICALMVGNASADPQYIVPGVPPLPIGLLPAVAPPPMGPLPMGPPIVPIPAPGYPSHPVFPIPGPLIGGHPRFFKREASATLSEPYAVKTKVENPDDGTKYQVEVQVDGHGNGRSLQQVEQTEKVHLTDDDSLLLAQILNNQQRKKDNRNKVYLMQKLQQRNMNRNLYQNDMMEQRRTMDNRDMMDNTQRNLIDERNRNRMRHHQNMMENSGRMEQLVVMHNRMTQKNFVDNREMLDQRYTIPDQNRLMQEMNGRDRQGNVVMGGSLKAERQRMSPMSMNRNILGQRNMMVTRQPMRVQTMNNQMGRNRIIDNMGVLKQRNSMDNQNMGMQEMNAQHGQRIRLNDNKVEQSPIFGRQMSLAGNLHGQMRVQDNTDNKRNSYTKMIASGRTKRSDDSYSYSVTALHPAVSKLSQVFNNGLSMERIRLGMNDGVMTSYVARPLTYIVTLPYSDLRTPAVMSQSPIY